MGRKPKPGKPSTNGDELVDALERSLAAGKVENHLDPSGKQLGSEADPHRNRIESDAESTPAGFTRYARPVNVWPDGIDWTQVAPDDVRRFIEQPATAEHAPFTDGARVVVTLEGHYRLEDAPAGMPYLDRSQRWERRTRQQPGVIVGLTHPSAAPELTKYVVALEPFTGPESYVTVPRGTLELVLSAAQLEDARTGGAGGIDPPF